MGDSIKIIKLEVEIQENGIIRNKSGKFIGRLGVGIEFDELIKEDKDD